MLLAELITLLSDPKQSLGEGIFYSHKQTLMVRMRWLAVPPFININQSFKTYIENPSEYAFPRKRVLVPAA